MSKNTLKTRKADNLLRRLGFAEKFDTKNRLTIADLIKPKDRCGIYALHFSNSEYYIGQAVDITRRFAQHSKNYNDIEYVSFYECRKKELDSKETEFVQKFEKHNFVLRNILLTSITYGATDLDDLIDQEEQKEWNENVGFQEWSGNRIDNLKIRKQYKRSFNEFSKSHEYNKIEDSIRNYVAVGIPFPIKTEYSFWCITIPNYGKDRHLSRININKQEVFSVQVDEEGIYYTFHLAKSPLIDYFGNNLKKKLSKEIGSLKFLQYTYKPGGQDQIGLLIDGRDFEKFIEKKYIKQAIRTFNLRLMRKGANFYNHYHCFELADRILKTSRANS